MSNLLASGFRRFFIDVYWHDGARKWQLCPVEIVSDNDGKGKRQAVDESTGTGSGSGSTASTTSQNSTEMEISVARESRTQLDGIADIAGVARGEEARDTVQNIGGYTCSKSQSFESLLEVFLEYFDTTENTLDAHMIYFILNLHSAEPADPSHHHQHSRAHHQHTNDNNETSAHSEDLSPTRNSLHGGPKDNTGSDKPEGLPSEESILSSIFSRMMGNKLYTPPTLQSERSNLNKSWYAVSQNSHPISEYFTVVENHGHLPYSSTPDGWPCESYMEMVLGKRALVAFGDISGKMSAYNFTADGEWIFASGTLAENANITLAPGATDNINNHDRTYKKHIEQGCLYNSKSHEINRTLDKWWYSPLLSPKGDPVTGTGIGDDDQNEHQSNFNYSEQLARDIVDCGVSLLANVTLDNRTADMHPVDYLDIVRTSIWSWADREPSSAGSASTLEDGRCAALDMKRDGQWRARDCNFHFYGACRVDNEPYTWVLTDKRVAYEDVDKHCPPGSHFSVPRTPLENTYLYALVISQPHKLAASGDDATKYSVWLDFNSMDVAQCWVVGRGRGGKAKCPYHISASGVDRKNVIVPTVAALIALAITALMLLVKCNVNRRNSRRKRVIEGWEYEGVPS